MEEWLVPLLVGVIGLGGVMVGQSGSRALEQARWRREEATRWHQERFRAYAELLGAVMEWQRLLTVTKPSDQTYVEIQEPIERFRTTMGTAEVLGGRLLRSTVQSTWTIYSSATMLYAKGEFEAASSAMGRSLPQALQEARDLLSGAVRDELDIPDGPTFPEPTPWQRKRHRLRLVHPRALRFRVAVWRQRRADNRQLHDRQESDN